MIVCSTVLNTATKVIEIYGGTTWTQISGKFLLAANSTYAVKATGGSANAIVPYHRHGVSKFNTGGMSANASHNHTMKDYDGINISMGSGYVGIYSVSGKKNVWTNTASVAHTHEVGAHNTNYVGTDGNTTGANMPPYYAVYIWERTA